MNNEAAIKALLRYSFEPVNYDYDKLTATEKSLVTREQFVDLTRWARQEEPKVRPGNIPMTPQIAAAFGPLLDLGWMDKEVEDTLKGTVILFGAYHHVTFVRVTTDDGVQVGTRDPYARLDDILTGAEGAGTTVEIPGFEGEWVVGLDPYRR